MQSSAALTHMICTRNNLWARSLLAQKWFPNQTLLQSTQNSILLSELGLCQLARCVLMSGTEENPFVFSPASIESSCSDSDSEARHVRRMWKLWCRGARAIARVRPAACWEFAGKGIPRLPSCKGKDKGAGKAKGKDDSDDDWGEWRAIKGTGKAKGKDDSDDDWGEWRVIKCKGKDNDKDGTKQKGKDKGKDKQGDKGNDKDKDKHKGKGDKGNGPPMGRGKGNAEPIGQVPPKHKGRQCTRAGETRAMVHSCAGAGAMTKDQSIGQGPPKHKGKGDNGNGPPLGRRRGNEQGSTHWERIANGHNGKEQGRIAKRAELFILDHQSDATAAAATAEKAPSAKASTASGHTSRADCGGPSPEHIPANMRQILRTQCTCCCKAQ